MSGTFSIENKVLPGSYVKFVSSARANASVSERGVAALLLPTDWNHGAVVSMRASDVKDSLALLGYTPESAEMRPIREMLCSCAEVLVCTVGSGTPATSEVGSAQCAGELGNSIRVKVSQNPDWTASNMKMDIITTVGGMEVDRQIGVHATVAMGEIKDNAFVKFDQTALLDRPTTHIFSGGMTLPLTGVEYQTALDRMESETFHTLAYGEGNSEISKLIVNYTKRMREECGAMFQSVLFGTNANYRGVVEAYDQNSVYWIAGALAGCAVNRSLTHAEYNGECTLTYPQTQSEKERAVEERKFAFQNVGGVLRVLTDINSEDDLVFGQNQTMRVLDQIAVDVANLFVARYLGKIQNSRAGRMSFWNDVVRLLSQLSELSAIDDFAAEDVAVEEGSEKSAVTVSMRVKPVCGMEKLYLTVTVL